MSEDMKAGTKLSLVIPCYNEENTLVDTVGRCLKLKEYGLDIELVIVDDCSTDNSREVAQKLSQEHTEISFHTHEKNQGKGAALRTGFLHATGDYVGIQDADAEYSPTDYVELLKPLQRGQADVVYGSRYLLTTPCSAAPTSRWPKKNWAGNPPCRWMRV